MNARWTEACELGRGTPDELLALAVEVIADGLPDDDGLCSTWATGAQLAMSLGVVARGERH
jgi:hypothetical protein